MFGIEFCLPPTGLKEDNYISKKIRHRAWDKKQVGRLEFCLPLKAICHLKHKAEKEEREITHARGN